MPFIQVQNYLVQFGRSATAADPPTLVHFLQMVPLPFVGAGNGIDTVTFTYRPGPADMTVGERNGRVVTAHFALDEFDVHRRILQSEAPVFVEWGEDPTTAPLLASVSLRTNEEPTGEGPVDLSG